MLQGAGTYARSSAGPGLSRAAAGAPRRRLRTRRRALLGAAGQQLLERVSHQKVGGHVWVAPRKEGHGLQSARQMDCGASKPSEGDCVHGTCLPSRAVQKCVSAATAQPLVLVRRRQPGACAAPSPPKPGKSSTAARADTPRPRPAAAAAAAAQEAGLCSEPASAGADARRARKRTEIGARACPPALGASSR